MKMDLYSPHSDLFFGQLLCVLLKTEEGKRQCLNLLKRPQKCNSAYELRIFIGNIQCYQKLETPKRHKVCKAKEGKKKCRSTGGWEAANT